MSQQTAPARPTKAEQAVRRIEAMAARSTETFRDGPRFRVTVKIEDEPAEYYPSHPSEVMFPAHQTATVTIYDELTGGSLWVAWRTVTSGAPRTTRFMCGDYHWTGGAKRRKIHTPRSLGSIVPTFLSL